MHEISDFSYEVEQEEDGRWIAEISSIPGAIAYGRNKTEAKTKAANIAYEKLGMRFGRVQDIYDKAKTIENLKAQVKALREALRKIAEMAGEEIRTGNSIPGSFVHQIEADSCAALDTGESRKEGSE